MGVRFEDRLRLLRYLSGEVFLSSGEMASMWRGEGEATPKGFLGTMGGVLGINVSSGEAGVIPWLVPSGSVLSGTLLEAGPAVGLDFWAVLFDERPRIQGGKCFLRTHWFALSTYALLSHAMVLIRGSQASFASAVGAR